MRIVPLFLMLSVPLVAGATFSIVAVDTSTGEVGGAGASCIANSRIINDLLVSLGAIHTQALYNGTNQRYAHELMLAGVPPSAIVDSLVAHDAQNNPAVRQYGLVDLLDGGRSAAYTGAGCTPWAGHRTGTVYAIQGNILLSLQIVDTMEYAFIHTAGPLAEKLLVALNAAKVPAADTRCEIYHKSSISAFIHVMRPGDPTGGSYLDLNVRSTSGSTDPIDVLDSLYEDWLARMSTTPDPYLSTIAVARDTLLADGRDTTLIIVVPRNNQGQVIGSGVDLSVWSNRGAAITDAVFSGDSVYTAILTSLPDDGPDTLVTYTLSGIRPGELRDHPIVYYANAARVSPSDVAQRDFQIVSVFPNPFNSTTAIHFDLSQPRRVQLSVYDVVGREAFRVVDQSLTAGRQAIVWNAEGAATGIYFAVLRSENQMVVKKLLLLK